MFLNDYSNCNNLGGFYRIDFDYKSMVIYGKDTWKELKEDVEKQIRLLKN